MKKIKFASLALAFLIVLSSFPAFAVKDTRDASPVLDSYMVGLYAEGNGSMSIEFEVFGTGFMDRIGVSYILIEEEILPGTWVPFDTVTPDIDDETFFSTDIYIHKDSYTFSGTPGLRYRATITAYAELDGISDTGEVTSPIRLCVY